MSWAELIGAVAARGAAALAMWQEAAADAQAAGYARPPRNGPPPPYGALDARLPALIVSYGTFVTRCGHRGSPIACVRVQFSDEGDGGMRFEGVISEEAFDASARHVVLDVEDGSIRSQLRYGVRCIDYASLKETFAL